MELFEQLRREYEFGIGTAKGVARTFGVHRRMVRQAVESALPPLRGYRPRSKPVVGPVAAFINSILAADATAPRKQRHTARRIHRRILAELPRHAIAKSTVRNHVRERRRVLGTEARATFVPQSYAWGSEAQVDWYEAVADLAGDPGSAGKVGLLRQNPRDATLGPLQLAQPRMAGGETRFVMEPPREDALEGRDRLGMAAGVRRARARTRQYQPGWKGLRSIARRTHLTASSGRPSKHSA